MLWNRISNWTEILQCTEYWYIKTLCDCLKFTFRFVGFWIYGSKAMDFYWFANGKYTILTKDLVYRGIGRKSTVENRKLPLQSLGDIISSPSRVDHSCQELDIHNVGELSWFLQVKEAILLHQLPNYFIGDLWREEMDSVNIFLCSDFANRAHIERVDVLAPSVLKKLCK